MQRRWLTMLSIAVLSALVLAACGSAEETPPGGSGDETHAPEHNFTLALDGHLTVGSDIPYPPFEFEDDDGNLTGFDVDLVREIASRLGLENADEDWISTNFDTIFQQLQSGARFDIIVAAVTAYAPDGSPAAETVAERKKRVDFTAPYYPSLQSLAIDTTQNADIQTVDDLPEGARVAVQRGTTGAFYAEKELTGAELVQFAQAPQMYQALQAGQVVAVFNDLPVSIESIKGKDNLEVVQQVDTGEEYAIGVSKENVELKDAIDEALQEMFDDGTFAEIFLKYFPEQDLPEYASE
ncbi:MAG TPA: transporter substrate-binding domain-containing protein [Actinomycetota bacterium]|nr:transporter substrate-binding domain-containing protein [Actinomycetota bacterium]